MYIEKIVKGKNKVGVRLQCSCLPFSISSFFFLHSVQKAMGYKNCYRIFLNFHRKKNSEGKHAWWRIVMCRKHHGNLFSPGQGRAWRNHMFTILGRAWRKHMFSIPGLVTLKPEPGEKMTYFTWYFQTPLPHDRFFAFQYLIANIIKAYPPFIFFFYTLTISRVMNLKKIKIKEFWNGRQEN